MTISSKNRAKSIALVLTTGFGLMGFIAGATQAQSTESDVLTKTVSYGDLNLETEAGAQMLYRRLRSASEAVCAPLESRLLSTQQAWRACYDKALDSAVHSINKSMVTAVDTKTRGASAG